MTGSREEWERNLGVRGAAGRWRKSVGDKVFVVDLHEDGTLTEWSESNPKETWPGTWTCGGANKFGVWLKLRIGKHATDVEGLYWGQELEGAENRATPVWMKPIT